MNRLEVPHPLAGLGLQTDEALGEQVVPRAIDAVIITAWRGRRQVDVIEVRVVCHPAPDVRAAVQLGRIAQPRVVTELAGLGDRVEGPQTFPRASIEGMDASGRARPTPPGTRNRAADDPPVARHQRPPSRYHGG